MNLCSCQVLSERQKTSLKISTMIERWNYQVIQTNMEKSEIKNKMEVASNVGNIDNLASKKNLLNNNHFILLQFSNEPLLLIWSRRPGFNPRSRHTKDFKKMVLATSLLYTQQYKIHIKVKVEQSREKSSTLPNTLV